MMKAPGLFRKFLLAGCAVTLVASLQGCSTGFTTIARRPPEKYEKLGQASGKSHRLARDTGNSLLFHSNGT